MARITYEAELQLKFCELLLGKSVLISLLSLKQIKKKNHSTLVPAVHCSVSCIAAAR